jgi:hypothetical protein
MWAVVTGLAGKPASAAPVSSAERTEQPQRSQPHRRPAAEVITILPVERGGEPSRVARGGVALGPAGTATALTPPVHGFTVTGEAISVAEKLAAQHRTGH